jgi:hypothetical protein
MKRRVEAVEIEVDGNEVRLIQRDPLDNGDAIIVISPDQIPQLVGWLREAEATIEQNSQPKAT